MLERLKEYKELIGIIVFFLGGFLWVQNSFPTKSDLKAEIGVLNCLLEKYMTLTQLQIRGRDLEREVQELNGQIGLIDAAGAGGPALSPAMKIEIDGRRDDLAARRNDLKAANLDMRRISDELARNACGRLQR